MGRLFFRFKPIVINSFIFLFLIYNADSQTVLDLSFTECSLGKKIRIGAGYQDSNIFIGGGLTYLLGNKNNSKSYAVFYQMWMAKDFSESIGVYLLLSRNIWNFSQVARLNFGTDIQYATHTNRTFNEFSGNPEIDRTYSLIETNLTLELIADLTNSISLTIKGGIGGVNRLYGGDAWEVSKLFQLGMRYKFEKR